MSGATPAEKHMETGGKADNTAQPDHFYFGRTSRPTTSGSVQDGKRVPLDLALIPAAAAPGARSSSSATVTSDASVAAAGTTTAMVVVASLAQRPIQPRNDAVEPSESKHHVALPSAQVAQAGTSVPPRTSYQYGPALPAPRGAAGDSTDQTDKISHPESAIVPIGQAKDYSKFSRDIVISEDALASTLQQLEKSEAEHRARPVLQSRKPQDPDETRHHTQPAQRQISAARGAGDIGLAPSTDYTYGPAWRPNAEADEARGAQQAALAEAAAANSDAGVSDAGSAHATAGPRAPSAMSSVRGGAPNNFAEIRRVSHPLTGATSADHLPAFKEPEIPEKQRQPSLVGLHKVAVKEAAVERRGRGDARAASLVGLHKLASKDEFFEEASGTASQRKPSIVGVHKLAAVDHGNEDVSAEQAAALAEEVQQFQGVDEATVLAGTVPSLQELAQTHVPEGDEGAATEKQAAMQAQQAAAPISAGENSTVGQAAATA